MKFRNLMAMDTEEMIRAQPMDAVVLIGGCDKTVPAQLMGAVSADMPAVMLIGGPMMTGRASRRAARRLHRLPALLGAIPRRRDRRATKSTTIEGNLATTAGTCAVMGTASTMACLAEALGMTLPGTAAIPAVHADRLRAAEASGRARRRADRHALRPSRIVTEQVGRERAARAARHRRFDQRASFISPPSRAAPASRCRSTAQRAVRRDAGPGRSQTDRRGYMEDLFAAGGIGAVLRELKPLCISTA